MVKPVVQINVWSDYVCPFCYLASPVLQRVAREYGAQVEINWRAFELRPEPIPTLDPNGEYLQEIWRRAVYPMAKERGMTLHLPPVQPRSLLAHEAAAYARSLGRFEAMNDAIFRGFFERGENIGDGEILAGIAGSVGVDPEGLKDALERSSCRSGVLDEESQAANLRISGVPAMLIASNDPQRALRLDGAQTYEVVSEAIARVVSAGRA